MLILIGVAAAVLFILNVVLKALLRRERVGFVDWTLAILATALMVAAMTVNQLQPEADLSWSQIALVTGAAVAIVGFVSLILEAVRKQGILASRGLLALGVGVLMALSTFSVPVTAEQLAFPTLTPIQVAQVAASTVAAPSATRIAPTRVVPTATPQPPTLTPLPSATRMPTATPWTFVTRTPLPTPTNVRPCLATTDFNLRLRAAPDREAETLVVIPFGTVVEVYGRNEASTWWYADFEEQSGWMDGEFLTRSANCDGLPVRAT